MTKQNIPEIVTATVAEFQAAIATMRSARRTRSVRPEVMAVWKMEVSEVKRLVNHDHKLGLGKVRPSCHLVALIHSSASRHGIKIRTTHQGDDLLVMRVE